MHPACLSRSCALGPHLHTPEKRHSETLSVGVRTAEFVGFGYQQERFFTFVPRPSTNLDRLLEALTV